MGLKVYEHLDVSMLAWIGEPIIPYQSCWRIHFSAIQSHFSRAGNNSNTCQLHHWGLEYVPNLNVLLYIIIHLSVLNLKKLTNNVHLILEVDTLLENFTCILLFYFFNKKEVMLHPSVYLPTSFHVYQDSEQTRERMCICRRKIFDSCVLNQNKYAKWCL